MTDTVYIIVPIYNAEKTLNKCIDSLLKQSYENISVLLIDDGSYDNSTEICDYYARLDKRINIIHKKNEGVMKARLDGIKCVPNEGYTTFCDADDFLPTDAIENLYLLIKKYNADLSCGNLQKVSGKGKLRLPKNIPPILSKEKLFEDDSIKDILPSFFGITNFPGYMPTKMYRNSVLKQIFFDSPVFFFQEDIAFNLQYTMNCKRIAVMPNTVYFYRIGGGTSKYMPTFLDDCISLYKYKRKKIIENELPNYFLNLINIELKNEIYTWITMVYRFKYGEIGESGIKKEISKICDNINICSIIKTIKNDTSGNKNFDKFLLNKDINAIYQLISKTTLKDNMKSKIKTLLLYI